MKWNETKTFQRLSLNEHFLLNEVGEIKLVNEA